MINHWTLWRRYQFPSFWSFKVHPNSAMCCIMYLFLSWLFSGMHILAQSHELREKCGNITETTVCHCLQQTTENDISNFWYFCGAAIMWFASDWFSGTRRQSVLIKTEIIQHTVTFVFYALFVTCGCSSSCIHVRIAGTTWCLKAAAQNQTQSFISVHLVYDPPYVFPHLTHIHLTEQSNLYKVHIQSHLQNDPFS